MHKVYIQKKISILDITNQYGATPLHYACYFGNRRVIDFLLDLGANINSLDQENNSCLHYAVNSGCTKTVKKMLLRGANKNLKNNEGKTAYDLANDMNNLEIAKILEKKNLIRKFICMESELLEFESSRNDLALFITLLLIIIFKLIYIFKIYYLIILIENKRHPNFNNHKSPDEGFNPLNREIIAGYVKCSLDDNCVFEMVITFLSLILDIVVIVILIYFMCFMGDKHIKSRNKKLRSNLSITV